MAFPKIPTCGCRLSVRLLRPRGSQQASTPPSGLSHTGASRTVYSHGLAGSARLSCTSDLAEAGVGGSLLIKRIGSSQSWLLTPVQSRAALLPTESSAPQHRLGKRLRRPWPEEAANGQRFPNYLKVFKKNVPGQQKSRCVNKMLF